MNYKMLNAEFKIGSLRGSRQIGLGYGLRTNCSASRYYGLWTVDCGLKKTTNS